MTDVSQGISMALTGIGSLSYGDQAGERMKLGLLLNDPEEEHDCFSDDTRNSHYFDGLGIGNVCTGRYVRMDGAVVRGAPFFVCPIDISWPMPDLCLTDQGGAHVGQQVGVLGGSWRHVHRHCGA